MIVEVLLLREGGYRERVGSFATKALRQKEAPRKEEGKWG